jgi:transcription initiation factor IIE alpha subunit
MDDYDEPANFAFCPTCESPLEFDDSMAEDGYTWWCESCEGYVRDVDVLDPSSGT